MAWLMGKDIVTYESGWWEQHCASGIIMKHTKNVLYMYNTGNRHFDPVISY